MRSWPGFRTNAAWKKAVAIGGYGLIVLFLLSGLQGDVNGFVTALVGVAIVLLIADYRGIRSALPLVSSASRLSVAVGWGLVVLAGFAIVASADNAFPRAPHPLSSAADHTALPTSNAASPSARVPGAVTSAPPSTATAIESSGLSSPTLVPKSTSVVAAALTAVPIVVPAPSSAPTPLPSIPVSASAPPSTQPAARPPQVPSAPAVVASTPTPYATNPATPIPTLASSLPIPTVAAPLPTTGSCGAPTNPWGYNFCAGSFITSPPDSFCSYFDCIANFWNGVGYVMQCSDSTLSLSGGRRGSCSYHGGNYRALYAP